MPETRKSTATIRSVRGNHLGKRLLYLRRDDVVSLLPTVPEQMDIAERTYLALAAGRVEMPPKPGVHPRADGFIHAMPAYLRDDDITALKWVSGYPSNRTLGFPYISGLIIVNDSETGLPISVMDAREITAARTAAASGVCIRRFAPADWGVVAMLGCGEQALYHCRVIAQLNPRAAIRAFDPDPTRTDALAREASGPFLRATSPRDAVRGADVIVTAGPIVSDPQPPITPEWLGESFLAVPIDFDFYFHASALGAAQLFVADDVAQFEYYHGRGHFARWPSPHTSLGDALARTDPLARVVCVNLGVGALDAAVAVPVLEEALRRGIGTWLAL